MSITSTTAVTQNFDGLGSGATATLPSGFKVTNGTTTAYSSGTTTTTQSAGTSGTGVLTGTSTGGTYNFANGVNSSSTDRAVGFITTGSFASPCYLYVQITNNGSATITALALTFDYEKYRTGTRAWAMAMQTSSDGSSWSGDITGSTQSYSADGSNAVVNPPTTTSMTVNLSSVSIAVGSSIYLRWSFTGSGGSTNAQGIGLDNLSVTATFASSGCSGTPSHATASASPSSFCAGNTSSLSMTGYSSGTGYSYQWQSATAASSGPYSSISGATNTGYTTSTLTATTYFRCVTTCTTTATYDTSSIATVSVTSSVTPSITTAASPSGAVCAGTSVTFTSTPVNGGGAPTYQWKKGGTNISGATNSTYSYVPVNGDVITCVLTSNAACASPTTATSSGITMAVNPLPSPTISGTTTISSGGSANLVFTGNTGDTVYYWNGSTTLFTAISGSSSSVSVSPTVTTTYSVTTATSSTGCTQSIIGQSAVITVSTAGPSDTIPSRDNNLAMGNPSNATTAATDSNNYLMVKSQYALSYNNRRGVPNWVSWHLSRAWKGSAARCDCFTQDGALPTGYYRASTSNYTGTGFDRGHLCPSDDRDGSDTDNAATFLMTNITPQAPFLNQQTWGNMEDYIRGLMDNGNEMYIVAGNYGTGGTGSSGGTTTSFASGNVTVPSHFWKVVVVLPVNINDLSRVSANTRVFAVDMPNLQSISPDAWESYKVSVDSIEALTGYNILSNVSSTIQSTLESKPEVTLAGWDFTNYNSPATAVATAIHPRMDTSTASSLNTITRGSGAASSTGTTSFRTTGFSNDGISTSNTDYFQFKVRVASGYTVSISSIDAAFAGTSTYYTSPGVTSRFAYSLDGSTFTLIGTPITSTNVGQMNFDFSGVSALQNLTSSTTVYFRYYASGQTAGGGWGFNSVDTGVYGVSVNGYISSAPATCSGTPAAGTATASPASVCSGGTTTASLSGHSTGTGYTYQWQSSTTGGSGTYSNISGATNTSYTTGTLTATAYLRCVTTCTTSATSNTSIADTITITAPVTPAVTIAVSPSGTVCSGTSVTYTATPTNGGTAPSYQWKKNSINISGATNVAYIYNPANNDSITCVLTSNAACASPATATSAVAVAIVTATVTPSVAIAASPAGTVCSGTSVTYTATPTNGGATPGYQWKRGSTSISGATNATYAYTPANGDTIYCTMTSNAACPSPASVNSGTIIMTVNPTSPTVNPITGSFFTTVGGTTTLSSATGGGTWASTTTSVATINSSGGVTGLTLGTSIISYTVTTSCGSNYDTAIVTVGAAVAVALTDTTWNFMTAATATGPSTFGTVPCDTIPGASFINVSQWNRNVITNASGTGFYSSQNWSLRSTLDSAQMEGKYMYFAITNSASTEFRLTKLNLVTQRSGTGPATAQMQYRVVGGTDQPFGTSASVPTSSGNVTFTGSLCIPPGQTDTIKVYGWGATGSTGTFRVANGTSISGSYVTGVSAITLSASSNSGPVCAGTSLSFTGGTASNGYAPYTYSWAGPASYGSTIQTPTISSPSASATGSYTYTVTDNLGCTIGNNTSATVNAVPTVTVTPVSSTICSGNTTNMTASGATTYTWAPSTGLSATTGATVTFNGTATATYTVTGTTAGCSGTATQTITVNPIPTVTVTPVASTICSGSTTSITASGATTYTWSPSAGLSATTGATVTFNGTTTGTYSVIGTTAGCSGAASQTITVNPIPTVTVTPASSSICAGNTTNMTATGATSYSWVPSTDLSATTGSVVTFGGTATATYSVTGTTAGCSNMATQTITVIPAPTVTVTPASSTICIGGSTNITATGGTSYSWSPSTGLSASTGATVTFSSATTSTYTVTGITAGCSGTATQTITVNPIPTVTLTPASSSICAGNTTNITATGATSYSWAPSSDLSATTGSVVTFSGTATATYSVTGTTAGCSSMATQTITIIPAPTVTVTPASSAICIGSSTNVTAAGASTYTWSPSAGLSATTGATVTFTGITTSIYTVTGTTSGCDGTATQTITVNPIPTITVTPTVACSGINTAVTASGATTYTWSPSTGLSATTGATVTFNNTATSTYTITGTSLGCTGLISQTITVNPLPTVTPILSARTSVLMGDTIVMSNATASGTWQSSSASIASVSTAGLVLGRAAGSGTISYTVTSLGCSTTVTKAVTVLAYTKIIVTVAGNGTAAFSGDGAAATAASLNNPHNMAVDALGNIYIAEGTNNRIRKVSAAGKITTIAGGGYSFSNGIPATAATFVEAHGVCVDTNGTIYIADYGGHRITKVDPATGIITLVAGTGTGGYSGDGGAATAARIYGPSTLFVDNSGNLIFTDQVNNLVRKIAPSGVISTIAGTGSATFSGDGGAATNAGLNNPSQVCADNLGNLYIGDDNNYRVRKINTSGVISTVAGNGTYGYSGDGGQATAANLAYAAGVSVDTSGYLYIAGFMDNEVRMVTPFGIINRIAGDRTASYSGDNGPATAAKVYYPRTTTVDKAGNIYIADRGNARIRRINTCPLPVVGEIAGSNTVCLGATTTLSDTSTGGTWSTSAASVASVSSTGVVTGIALGTAIITYKKSNSCGVAGNTQVIRVITQPTVVVTPTASTICSRSNIIASGATTYTWTPASGLSSTTGATVYVTSPGTYTVTGTNSCGSSSTTRTFALDSQLARGYTITTFAGTGTSGFSGDGGAATAANMRPSGICVSASGELYLADANNNRVRKINTSGIISTVAGNGFASFSGDGGAATAASLNFPGEITLDQNANLYIADRSNNRIRKVNTAGVINTVAGTGTTGSSGDGGAATSATMSDPRAIAFDNSGNMYIVDNGNHTIRVVDRYGVIRRFAGSYSSGFGGDGGAATAAQLNGPTDVISDSSGNIYIVDNGNNRIRKVAPSGIITTFAGTGTGGFSGDGGQATAARLSAPYKIEIDGLGNFFIADNANLRTRKINTDGIISTIAGTGTTGYSGDGGPATSANLNSVFGLSLDGAGNIYLSDAGNQRIRKLTPALAPITGASSVCMSAATSLSDSVSGGVWSSSSSTLASVSSAGSVLGLGVGIATISYTVTNTCGTAVATSNITVNPVPTVSLTASASTICTGSSTTLTASGATTYSWSPSTGLSATTGATVTFSGATTSTFTVTGTTAGCSATASQTITVNPVPTVTVTPSVACSGVNTPIIASGATTYTWAPSSGLSATTGATVTFNSTATSTYTITGTSLGCTGLISQTITVNPIPTVTVTPASSTICVGAALTASGATTYNWTPAAGLSATTGATVTTTATTTVTYTITGTAATCSSSVTRTYTVTPAPTITSVSPLKGYTPSSVTITGSNFNSTANRNIVWFGATKATISSGSATSLSVTAPIGATYMPVSVTDTATGCGLSGYAQYPYLPTFDTTPYLRGIINVDTRTDFTTSSTPTSVAIGDLDGDGKADLAVTNISSNSVSVFRNTSSSGSISSGSFATRVDFTTGSGPTSAVIGDLDGDGKADLVVVNIASGTVSVFRNTSSSGSISSGSFATKVDFTTGNAPSRVAIGDLDGDGKADLAVTNYNDNTVSVYRNTSSSGSITSSSFATRVNFTTGTAPRSVAIGDLDGDGKADLSVANYGSNTVSVFRNTSSSGSINTGSFAAKVDFTTGSTPSSVAIGDLDGDGKADLAVANQVSDSVSVLRNTSSSGSISSGSFATKVDFASGHGPSRVAIGDLNGDGKADLAVANYVSNTVSVFRNTSSSGSINTGSFAAKVDFTTGTNPWSVAIGDLDGDGKADLAVHNEGSNTVSVLRNNPLYPIAGAGTLCTGSTSTLTDSTSGGTWTSSATSIATVNGATGVVTGVAAGTVIITYAVNGGIDTALVTVNATPMVTVTPVASTICSGSTSNITASGATTYTWSPSTGLSASTGATVTFSGTSTTTYTITGSSALGCSSSTLQVITVNPLPSSSFTISRSPVCINTADTFTSGAPLCSVNALVTSSSAASYARGVVASTATNNITMEAWVKWNGTNGRDQMIMLNGSLWLNGYGVAVRSGVSTLSILVAGVAWLPTTATLTSGTWQHVTALRRSGSWEIYVDGTSYSVTTPTTAPTTPNGRFFVSNDSTAVDNFNGTIDEVKFWTTARTTTEIAADRIACNTSPQAALAGYWKFDESSGSTAADASGNGRTLTVSATSFTASANSLSTYAWSFGDGATASINSAVRTYTASGTYSPSLTVTNAYGCTSTTVNSLTVTPVPVLTVTPVAASICNGSNTSITAAGATTYTWLPAATLSATTGATVTASPTAAVTYTVTGTASGCSSNITQTITINPIPVLTVTPVVSGICPGGSSNITTSGASSYSWSPATGLTATTGATVTASPTVSTTYTVTGTSALGCVGTATQTITVNPLPSSSFTVTPSPVCVAAPATFTSGAPLCSVNAFDMAGSRYGSVSLFSTATDNITIEAWVKWSNTATSGGYQFLLLNGVSGGNGYGLLIRPGTTTLSIFMGGIGTFLNSTAVLAYGQWQHVAIVRNAGTWSLYLDGNQYSVTSATSTPLTPTSGFYVGSNNAGGELFNGLVDEVKFWSAVRTTANIQADRIACYTAPQTNFAGYWKFDEGSGTSVADGSGNTRSLTLSSSAGWVSSPVALNTYAWSFGDGATASVNSAVRTYTASGTYSPSLTVTNAYGCTSTTVNSLTVTPVPVLTVTPVAASICNGSNTSITAAGATTYSWLPAATLSATTGATVTASPTAAVTYTVTGTASGCSSNITQTITINPIPVLTVTPVASTICQGTSTNITAAGASSYSWSPASGLLTTTGTTITASPSVTTTYTLTGTSALGCLGTASQTITVNPAPSSSFSISRSPICVNLADTFTAGAPLCSVNAFDMAGSRNASRSVISTATDNITIEAWVKWSNTGTPSANQFIFINGNSGSSGYGLFIRSGTNTLSILLAGVIFLNSSAVLNYGQWQHVAIVRSSGTWSVYVDGTAYSVSTPTSTPNTPTTGFYVASNNGGSECFNGIVDEVKFWTSVRTTTNIQADRLACYTAPQTNFAGYWKFDEGTGTSVADGSGNSRNLTLSSSAGWVTSPVVLNTYAWSFGDGTTASVGSVVKTYTTAATYSPTLIVTNANGCTSTTVNTLTVTPIPTVTVTPVSSTICSGNTTDMTASGATSYAWAPSAGLSASTGATVTFNGTTTATYTVTGTTGCTATRAQTITVNPSLTVTVTPVASTICSGATTNMTASGATSYTWSPSAGLSATTGATVTFSGLTTSTYTVIGTLTGCSGSRTQTITVNPIPTVTATPASPTICLGSTTGITASGATTYSWSPAIGLIATTGATVTFIGTATATYTVTGTSSGCSGQGSTTVTVGNQATWVGATSNDWYTPANWDCGAVPTVSLDVLIPAGTAYQPLIASDSNAFSRNLTFNPNTRVAIQARAVLHTKGDLTANGTASGAGSLSLDGTIAQTIRGMGYCNNFALNNSSGATIPTGSHLSVDSLLTITSGTLTTNDSLILGGDSLITPRLAPLGTVAAISGKAKVVLPILGGYRRYRFWSHPFIDTVPLSQMQQYIDITGAGGTTNGFTATITNLPSAFRYATLGGNSTLSYDPGWRAYTSALATAADSNKIARYQGMRVYLRGKKGEGLGYDYLTYTPHATKIGQWGTLNQGRQKINLIKGAGTGQDYNLLGNPYAAPVDIGTVLFNAKQSGNIIGSFYVWNPFLGAGGQFVVQPISTVTATPYYLPAGSAFEVRTAHNGDSLIFNETDKGIVPSATLLRTEPEYTVLTIYDNSYHPWDRLMIRFDSTATDEQDNVNDADKLIGGDLNFYSLSSDGKRQAIDVRPYGDGKVIPLGITSSYVQDFIMRTESVLIPEGGELYLHDKLLETYTKMEQGSEYRFSLTKDKATQGNDRFELSMKNSGATAASDKEVSLYPNPAQDNLVIARNQVVGDLRITLTDVNGTVLFSSTQKANLSTYTLSLLRLAAGMYYVKVEGEKYSTVKSVIKQ